MDLQPTILIVDDEKHTRDGLRRLLENEYDAYVAADIAGASDVLEREQIDILLTDLRLGNENGMTLIDRALKMPHPPICIMMTAYGSVDIAVEAMKRGGELGHQQRMAVETLEDAAAHRVGERREDLVEPRLIGAGRGSLGDELQRCRLHGHLMCLISSSRLIVNISIDYRAPSAHALSQTFRVPALPRALNALR